MICGAAEISMDCLDNPPRWIRVEPQFDEGVKIRYHRISPVLLFLIPFTAVWSGGSIEASMGVSGSRGTSTCSNRSSASLSPSEPSSS